jgi:hypothetical protein
LIVSKSHQLIRKALWVYKQKNAWHKLFSTVQRRCFKAINIPILRIFIPNFDDTEAYLTSAFQMALL